LKIKKFRSFICILTCLAPSNDLPTNLSPPLLHLGPPPRRLSSYIAAIDQGTSSTRVILYCSDTLQPKASHQIDLQSATSTPHPGWVEMNPTALLQSVETCFEHALAKAETTASSVVSVGLSL
jgi:hypothetical protein